MRLYNLIVVLGIVCVVIGMVATPVSSAPEMSPAVRPTIDPGGNGGGGDGDDGGDDDDGPASGSLCAALSGQVINWGFGPEANVQVDLKTGSWETFARSASDGNYGFGGLGVGIARLQVALSPEQSANLQPLIQDAAVYLNCDFPIIANIALYNGPRPDPPARIEMSAPQSVAVDKVTPIRLTVKNDFPNDITNVIVTDLMPMGLRAVAVKTVAAPPENVHLIEGGAEGQLAVVYLDRLAAGSEANIIIDVMAEGSLAGTQLRNTATLFYRESTADQAWVDLSVGRSGSPVVVAAAATATVAPAEEAEPTSAAPTPSPEPSPAATATAEVATASSEQFVAPDEHLPTTGDDFVPPEMLPVTGEIELPAALPNTGLNMILPISGLALIGLAFVAHMVRSWRNR